MLGDGVGDFLLVLLLGLSNLPRMLKLHIFFKKTLQPVLEENGGIWEPGPRVHSKHGGRRQCS